MNLIFRAYYALIGRPLRTRDGRNTSAIFGFARMLLKAVADHRPDYVAIALEGGGPSFREEIYAEYKATRKPPPDDLVAQIEPIKALARSLGFAVIEREGMEADDVIATLARRAGAAEVLILSGDKDLMALVGPRVRLLAPKTGVSDLDVVDEEGVRAKLGIPPAAVVDLLALEGDAVDNIPGVPGVGEKTAAQLLQRYGSLEKVYENLDKIEPTRVRNALARGREQAELSRRLATLKDDLPLDLALEDLAPRPRDENALRALLNEYELKTLAAELDVAPAAADAVTSAAATVDAEDFVRGASHAPAGGWLAVEPFFHGGLFAGVVVADPGGRTATFDGQPADIARRLRHLYEESHLPFAAHETKRLHHFLGDEVTFDFDTMLAAYLLNPDRTNYRLEDLVFEYLKTSLRPQAPGTLDFGGGAADATARALAVNRLAAVLEKGIAALQMDDLLRQMEVPLAPVLAAMEKRGVRIDRDHFKNLGRQFNREIKKAEAELYELAGAEFNPNSPTQLREILFDKLGLKPKRKTKTGFSTAADVLEELADEHPLPAKILAYRELAKLKNTYVDVLPDLADAEGRVHTTFNQTGTGTGRLSSSDPNLQNIPIRTELGAEIRRGFIPGEGLVFLSADYAQVELRILAHVADDPGLQGAFAEGKDIHAATAAEIFDTPFAKVTKDQRRIAKAINFGLAYKMGPRRLARETGLSADQAKKYIEKYFQRYPGVQRYIAEQVDRARVQGYVQTVLGRRRPLPDITSRDNRARAQAERVAVNMPIQGTAADLLKLAMVAVARRLRTENLRAWMLLTIHDELLFEAEEKTVPKLKRIVREEMTGVMSLKVPLEVHIGVGKNWLEAHG